MKTAGYQFPEYDAEDENPFMGCSSYVNASAGRGELKVKGTEKA